MAEDQFKWSADNPDVVVQGQEAVAIYENDRGQIVIRQEAGPMGEEDNFIVVDRRFIKEFIKRLQAVAKAKS